MRILHMIDSLTMGGAQRLLVTFGREAKQHGIQTSIICLRNEEPNSVGEELRSMGLLVSYFFSPHMMDAKRIWRVVQYIRKNRPDVIQTHLLNSNVIGGLIGLIEGIPVIATLHSTTAGLVNPRWRDWLETQVMKRLDRRVVAFGYKTAEAHKNRLGNKKINVIPLGVSLPIQLTIEERSSIRRELIGDDNKLLLISVGRLAPPKAFEDLIRAFASLHSQYPQSVLALVGDGKLRSALESLTRSLSLEHSIIFLGNRSDVPRLLAASDLFLCSSVSEAGPLVVIEAMLACLPVVATSVGDVPLMLKAGCGVIVPPGQPQQLAKAAADLLQEGEKMKLMGIRAREHAMQNYSTSAWMDRLRDIYREVVPSRIVDALS